METNGHSKEKQPAVFLDRDGVLNVPPEPGGYILKPEDFKLETGAARAVKRLKNAGYFLSVATNQRCVGVGLITAEQLDAIHERMQQLIEKGAGQRLDAIYYSPDDRNSNSMTRKPAPGMLLQAAEDHGLDLERSWMIGDSVKDIGAALSAGVRPILIENPASSETRGFLSPDVQEKTVIVATISEAVSIILSGSKQNKRFF